MTIVEFLEARIAEDEALAQAAAESTTPAMDTSREPVGPTWEDGDGMVLGKLDKDGYPIPLWDNEGSWTLSMDPAVSAHVARHDPARVLAECAAKRAIIKEWEDPASLQDYDREGAFYASAITHVLECLAAVYKDHPDYQEEWSV
jgi:hypothetical protein